MEENFETEKKGIVKPARATLYAITAIITPLMGTLLGVFSAFNLAVANMTATDEMPSNYPDRWFVQAVSYKAIENFISEGILRLTAIGLVFIAGVVILCILTGRFGRKCDENGEIAGPEGIQLNWFDELWTEVSLLLFILAVTGAVCLAYPILDMMPCSDMFSEVYKPWQVDAYYYGISNKSVMILCAAGMLICIEVAILSFVSIVKKLKAHKFFETSLIIIIAKWIIDRIHEVDQKLSASEEGNAGKLLAIKYSAIFIVLFFIAMFIGSTTYATFGAIGMIVLVLYFVPKKLARFMEIRNGVAEVKNGNLDKKIPYKENENGPIDEMDKLAADINCISQATYIAIQNELKNQRMKTDLISNVSHDLKTPLTSMISYVDILKKEGLDSPKAPEYLAIIDEKTSKLKSLTEDLFEAAKASSGNIPCELLAIDMNSMLDQELAEMSEFLDNNKLKIIKTCKVENTKVMADGKLLSRVIENVLGNVSKYALPKSRVYIDLLENPLNSGQLLLEVKNISKDQLNISADELMERFTRGDDSRNTDGSGLGLSIAKDLTRIMGGSFGITIDGDMFKASIIMNLA